LCFGFLTAIYVEQTRAATGQLQLIVVDKDTGTPIPFRLHLVGPKKQPRKLDKMPFWYDHNAVPGKILLRLPLGDYKFVVERGLEYLDVTGQFTLLPFADDTKRIELCRFIDMKADGWWSGDLDVQRPLQDIELLMKADDLHVAQVVTWRNDKNLLTNHPAKEAVVQFDNSYFYSPTAGVLSRRGNELLLLNLAAPLKLPGADADFPPIVDLLLNAKKKEKGELWIDVTKPYWWDLPMLVAAGQVDSIEIAHSRLVRDGGNLDEADGRPRDRKRYPSYQGNGEWSQDIYFRLLNCGLRIPPSAGSGSGDAPNPVGYCRMYVHVDGDLTYEKWWKSFRAGQVFVTNGPLMKPAADGELPGHIFHADAGAKLEIQPTLTFSTRWPVNYLEIIKDGRVVKEVPFDQYVKEGKLPTIEFDRSGWFALRAVVDSRKTYQFAMTAPFYVEIGYERRISRSAAQFFLDWVVERARQIKQTNPERQKAILQSYRDARDYWHDVLSKANAE
jgi:hypothetical protein